ncbi:hypothetical protein APED_09735 [Acanthopleuribacter pedis]
MNPWHHQSRARHLSLVPNPASGGIRKHTFKRFFGPFVIHLAGVFPLVLGADFRGTLKVSAAFFGVTQALQEVADQVQHVGKIGAR